MEGAERKRIARLAAIGKNRRFIIGASVIAG
jgi:hypothetical protein